MKCGTQICIASYLLDFIYSVFSEEQKWSLILASEMLGLWQVLTLLSACGVGVWGVLLCILFSFCATIGEAALLKLYFSVIQALILENGARLDVVSIASIHSAVAQTLTHTQIQTVSIYTSKVPVCWWVIRLLCYSPAACNGHFCRNKSTPTYWEWYYMIMFLAVCKNPRQHCCFHFLQCIITHFCSHLFPFANTHKPKDQTRGFFLCRRHSLC